MWLCNVRTFAELFVSELGLYGVVANIDDLKIRSLNPLTLVYSCKDCCCKFVDYDGRVKLEIIYKDEITGKIRSV